MRRRIAKSSWVQGLIVIVVWLGARVPVAYYSSSDPAGWADLKQILPLEVTLAFVAGVMAAIVFEIELRHKARKKRFARD